MIAAHRHRHGLMFPKSAAFRLEPQILGNDGIAALSPGVRLVDQEPAPRTRLRAARRNLRGVIMIAATSTLIRRQDQQDLDQFLESHFCQLQALLDRLEESGEFTPEAQDAVSSFGERLSSRIVTMALRKSGMETIHFDSRVLIRTDKQHTQATPLLKETYANVRRALASLDMGVVPVFGGFIGSTSTGATTTLGRSSSNLTAVLLAGALRAEEVEIHDRALDGKIGLHGQRPLAHPAAMDEDVHMADALRRVRNAVCVHQIERLDPMPLRPIAQLPHALQLVGPARRENE